MSNPPSVFRISALVRITLLSLYVALTLPLPFLAKATSGDFWNLGLILGLIVGIIALWVALSEQVIVDEHGISLEYPLVYLNWILGRRSGWKIAWREIKALKPRTTGQGGLIYYFLSNSGEAYLLPMRVAGFGRLVAEVQTKTGLDTSDIKPLAQPWMYLILLVMTFLLMLVDGWVIFTAFSLGKLV